MKAKYYKGRLNGRPDFSINVEISLSCLQLQKGQNRRIAGFTMAPSADLAKFQKTKQNKQIKGLQPPQ